jgi:hypothetical protein
VFLDSYIIKLIDSDFNEYLGNFYFVFRQNRCNKGMIYRRENGQGAVRTKRAPEMTPAEESYLLA